MFIVTEYAALIRRKWLAQKFCILFTFSYLVIALLPIRTYLYMFLKDLLKNLVKNNNNNNNNKKQTNAPQIKTPIKNKHLPPQKKIHSRQEMQNYSAELKFEQWHDKTNKMSVRERKIQTKVSTYTFKSESSLYNQWVTEMTQAFFMQTARTLVKLRLPRLIWSRGYKTFFMLSRARNLSCS